MKGHEVLKTVKEGAFTLWVIIDIQGHCTVHREYEEFSDEVQ